MLDRVPRAMFERASGRVSVALTPAELDLLKRRARRHGVAASALAHELLVAGLRIQPKGARRRAVTRRPATSAPIEIETMGSTTAAGTDPR